MPGPRPAVSLTFCALLVACVPIQSTASTDGATMTDDSLITTVETTDDPDELVVALVHLAQSAEPSSHQYLGQRLGDPTLLTRLDSEDDYAQPPDFLRLSAVLDALVKNQAPTAQGAIVTLAVSEAFVEAPSRAELLLRATEAIRPPPDGLVAFWNRLADPADVYMHLLMRTLVNNGTPAALEIYERVIADPSHLAQTVPCVTGTDSSCYETVATDLGRWAFRRHQTFGFSR